jgi:hypothetical protein
VEGRYRFILLAATGTTRWISPYFRTRLTDYPSAVVVLRVDDDQDDVGRFPRQPRANPLSHPCTAGRVPLIVTAGIESLGFLQAKPG